MYALADRVPCEPKAVMIGGLPGADKPGALSQAVVGRPSEALTVDQEAVAIRRELAAASPDRHRPDLANALDNLGVWFLGTGSPGRSRRRSQRSHEASHATGPMTSMRLCQIRAQTSRCH